MKTDLTAVSPAKCCSLLPTYWQWNLDGWRLATV